MAAMTKYTVRYEWDPDGAWIITVPDVPGCRTEAKTFQEGQRLIRDALSLFVDDARTAILVNTVVPPPGLTRAVQRAKAADREISRSLAKDLRLPPKDAQRLLTGARLSDVVMDQEIVYGRDVTIVAEKMPTKDQKKSGQGASTKAGARRSRSQRGR